MLSALLSGSSSSGQIKRRILHPSSNPDFSRKKKKKKEHIRRQISNVALNPARRAPRGAVQLQKLILLPSVLNLADICIDV